MDLKDLLGKLNGPGPWSARFHYKVKTRDEGERIVRIIQGIVIEDKTETIWLQLEED